MEYTKPVGKFAVLYLHQKDVSAIQRDLDKRAQVCVWRERDHLHCDRLCSGGVQRHSQIPPASLEEAQCYGATLLSTWLVDGRFRPPCLVSKAVVRACARRRRSGSGRAGGCHRRSPVKLI